MNVLFLNKAFMVKHSQEVFLENSDCPGCILFILKILNWKKKSLAEWFKRKRKKDVSQLSWWIVAPSDSHSLALVMFHSGVVESSMTPGGKVQH